MSEQTVEARAVKIAVQVMQAAGLCRYASPAECRRRHIDKETCDRCIEAWLIAKAREELKSRKEEVGSEGQGYSTEGWSQQLMHRFERIR